MLLLVVFFFVVFEGVATLLPDADFPDRVSDPLREAPEERALLEGEALEEPTRRLAVPALVRLEVVLALLARLVVNAGVRSARETDLGVDDTGGRHILKLMGGRERSSSPPGRLTTGP